MTLPVIGHPILVISYNADTRMAITHTLQRSNAFGVPCKSFLEAEDLALNGLYSGILVDLPSMVKAKGEEKVVACSLTGFYPTLRVRNLEALFVPMGMPGAERQSTPLSDFLTKTCSAFIPRRLRFFRRRDIVISVIRTCSAPGDRLFTVNMSWGGAFIAEVYPEKYVIGQDIQFSFPEFNNAFTASVCSIHLWGQRKIPGIGVAFRDLDEAMESILAELLQHDRSTDRDRIIAC